MCAFNCCNLLIRSLQQKLNIIATPWTSQNLIQFLKLKFMRSSIILVLKSNNNVQVQFHKWGLGRITYTQLYPYLVQVRIISEGPSVQVTHILLIWKENTILNEYNVEIHVGRKRCSLELFIWSSACIYVS